MQLWGCLRTRLPVLTPAQKKSSRGRLNLKSRLSQPYDRGATSALIPCAIITTSTFFMPSHITSQQYGQAVLDHVQNGAYPDSEEVISADFPPSALPEVSKLIEQAREDVKVCLPLFYWHLNVVGNIDHRLVSGKPAEIVPRISMAGLLKPSSYESTYRNLRR